MAEGNPELDALNAKITSQASQVRELKQAGADKAKIESAVEELKRLRADFEQKVKLYHKSTAGDSVSFDRAGLEGVLKRRFFIAPAFEIYGGVGGLYDFGPPGCAFKANMLQLWRQHFVLEENMLEVDTTTVTPEVVLKTSGHVDKFNDFLVKDEKTGDCYRADKILEDVLDKMMAEPTVTEARRAELDRVRAQAGAMGQEQLSKALKEYNVKAPDTGNDLSEPKPFNLMFQTQIGPSGNLTGYMRPETAQGIFVNFKRLLEHNGGRMPFAGAQIGLAFRNEIAPRSGLIRVREFTLAEIEHFVNPNDKAHAKFSSIADIEMQLFPRDAQLTTGKTIKMKVGEAVKSGMINNETLGYFMARTHLFMTRAGVRPEFLRFRQHLSTEMAHYACDCWDAEIRMSIGWVECVGHADRACFDLKAHSDKSKTELVAWEDFKEPQMVEVLETLPNKGLLGTTFRTDSKKVLEHLTTLEEHAALQLQVQLDAAGSASVTLATGQAATITKEMVAFKKTTKKVNGRNYYPSVIEPSFGIGRIMTGILEHAYYVREGDEQRAVLRLPALVAPVKCAVFPLQGNDKFAPLVQKLYNSLIAAGLATRMDDSSTSIGKRYARFDELGTPFACTIDFDSLADESCTLRERDSCKQVRGKMAEMPALIRGLCEGSVTWESVCERLPSVTVKE
eukprot:tig00000478_g1262.t1